MDVHRFDRSYVCRGYMQRSYPACSSNIQIVRSFRLHSQRFPRDVLHVRYVDRRWVHARYSHQCLHELKPKIWTATFDALRFRTMLPLML